MTAPQHGPPEGMDGYDYYALSEQQQERLNEHKINTRIANEHYLREHPELDCLLKKMISGVLTDRPSNIHEYCAQFFSKQPLDQLAQSLSEDVHKMKREKSHVEELLSVAQTIPADELLFNEKPESSRVK